MIQFDFIEATDTVRITIIDAYGIAWEDEIPDGNDHSIDAVRYAMLDDCLRG